MRWLLELSLRELKILIKDLKLIFGSIVSRNFRSHQKIACYCSFHLMHGLNVSGQYLLVYKVSKTIFPKHIDWLFWNIFEKFWKIIKYEQWRIGLTQKYTNCKNYTIFFQSSWYFSRMASSWLSNFGRISTWLNKNSRSFINSTFLCHSYVLLLVP